MTGLTGSSLKGSQLRWFYGITALFALTLCFAIMEGMMIMAGLPLVFLLLLIMIFRLDLAVYFAVLVTPFSLNLAHTGIGIGVSLPSEPLMFGLFMIYSLKLFQDGGVKPEIVRHPVTIIILLHLAWYVITTIGSSMPLVSFKSTLARFCFITVFYFMLLELFVKTENIRRFIWLYLSPLLAVIAYTVFMHALGDFSEDAAHTAMVPFYNDHTAYAAVLSFFIPVTIAFLLDKKTGGIARYLMFLVLLILILAVVLSYTRAAWVGLLAALSCSLIFFLRVKSALVYSGIAAVLLIAFLFRSQITMQLESNKQVSSDDYAAHVQSIGNISSDDSNIERLNRWACALRMFADRPVLGFGPGTYMFQYGRYQKFSERSGISTNFAEGGGSHSEYLGPLSEQGFIAPILLILLIAFTVQTTANYIRRTAVYANRVLARGLLLGLITYWVHGVLNYFLDTEKASVPYWGFIAALVALQVYDTTDRTQKSVDAVEPAAQ